MDMAEGKWSQPEWRERLRCWDPPSGSAGDPLGRGRKGGPEDDARPVVERRLSAVAWDVESLGEARGGVWAAAAVGGDGFADDRTALAGGEGAF